jgi:hypothetical protein
MPTINSISKLSMPGNIPAASNAGTHISSHVFMFSFEAHAENQIREAAEAALLEGAEIVRQAGERKALAGMKGGAWVGMSPEPLNENIRKRAVRTGHDPVVEVGTHVRHGFFWEIGHRNIFLNNQYVRNNWLTQALFENMRKVVAAIRAMMLFHSRTAKIPAIFVGTRTFLYTAGKYLADLNAVFQIAGLSQYRGVMLKTARVLGDVNAWHRGMIGPRILRRGVGRVASKGLLTQLKRGGGNFPVNRRIIRRFTGARMARMWSLNKLDHRRL